MLPLFSSSWPHTQDSRQSRLGRCAGRTLPRQLACQSPPLRGKRKRGEEVQAIGRSRGGRTSKIHALADHRGRPIAFALTPGNIADISMAQAIVAAVDAPKSLIADKAYDAEHFRNWLANRRIKAVIHLPHHAGRRIRSTATPTEGAMLSSAYSASSRTGVASPHAMTAWPKIIWLPWLLQPLSSRGSNESQPSTTLAYFLRCWAFLGFPEGVLRDS